MTPVELSRTVLHAVRRAVDGGELSVTVPERVVVGPPGPGGCGDYATSIALQLARPAGQPPLRVAGILKAHLLDPGLGIDLDSGTGTDLGSGNPIEDVVVTPPGFLNIRLRDSAPAALVEDILRCGVRYGYAHTTRPDARPDARADARPGAQPDSAPLHLHAPREVRALVVMDVVARLLRAQGADVRTTCDAPPDPGWVRILGIDAPGTPDALDAPGTPGTLDALGIPDAPGIPHALGTPNALNGPHAPNDPHAPDGPHSPDRHRIQPVPADPAGPHPTTLGRDAGRWALLHPASHDRPRIGDEHLVQRECNPLFRVRYAHARTRALLRNAADLGFTPEPGPLAEPGTRSSTRTGPGANPFSPPARLLATLATHPRILATAATTHAPDRLARHLVDVADAVLPFLPSVLPVGEEKPSAAHRARLALAEAAGTVLAGGLSLLGIDAPDHL